MSLSIFNRMIQSISDTSRGREEGLHIDIWDIVVFPLNFFLTVQMMSCSRDPWVTGR